MRSIRPWGALLGALLLAALTAAPGHTATYQYWNYFHASDGTWASAMEGATYVPADGTIEGWRFVETSGDEVAPTPRVAPDFDSLCASVAPEAGMKRVGLVIDYGTVDPADERDTFSTCLLLEPQADGFAVLEAATTYATSEGMLTCIQGVPSATCEPVPDQVATTSTASEETGATFSVATVTFIAASIVLVLAYLVRRRRNS